MNLKDRLERLNYSIHSNGYKDSAINEAMSAIDELTQLRAERDKYQEEADRRTRELELTYPVQMKLRSALAVAEEALKWISTYPYSEYNTKVHCKTTLAEIAKLKEGK